MVLDVNNLCACFHSLPLFANGRPLQDGATWTEGEKINNSPVVSMTFILSILALINAGDRRRETS